MLVQFFKLVARRGSASFKQNVCEGDNYTVAKLWRLSIIHPGSVKRSLEESKAGKKRVKSKLNLEVKTKGKGKFRKGYLM